MFIDLPSREHRVYIALYFQCVAMGGVRVKFLTIILIVQLSVSFVDVIFLAEHDYHRPFVCWFNNNICPLSEVLEGLSFDGWKVVFTFLLILSSSRR